MEKNDREVIKNLQAALASPKFSADDQKRALPLKKTKLEGQAAGSQGDALEAKKQALLKEKADLVKMQEIKLLEAEVRALKGDVSAPAETEPRAQGPRSVRGFPGVGRGYREGPGGLEFAKG